MINQKDLAKLARCSSQHLSYIVNCKKDASKALAIKLGEFTGTEPAIWIFGTTTERRAAVHKLRTPRA